MVEDTYEGWIRKRNNEFRLENKTREITQLTIKLDHLEMNFFPLPTPHPPPPPPSKKFLFENLIEILLFRRKGLRFLEKYIL